MTNINSEAAIRDWLAERLAKSLRLEKTGIDPDTPFSRYALDSLDAVTLVVDIEEQLGVELPSTLLWDYPTVNQCVGYLVSVLQGEVVPG